MTGAMYAAIGGLKTHMSNLNVIGNNIANVNTAGYKAQRMTFEESLYVTNKAGSNGGLTSGGNAPSQVGYGCTVGSIDLNMTDGTFNPTGFGLDCMIEGDGFFMTGSKDTVINGAADLTKLQLTRVGDLRIDNDGYLVKRDGSLVFGFATVQNPYYNPNATPEEVAAAKEAGFNTTDQYVVSSQLTPLRLPLAADVPTIENGGLDANGENPKWETGDPVYNVLTAIDANSTTNARGSMSLVDSDGNLIFDLENKELPAGVGGTHSDDDKTANKVYEGPIPNTDDKVIVCKGLKINENGAIMGTCDTGKSVVLGYVGIATVDAPDGVTHVGGSYYQCLEGAGEMSVCVPGGVLGGRFLNNQMVTGEDDAQVSPSVKDAIGKGGGNKFQPGGLESSTADVATEFANMIVTQRGYQANTRIVTVTDSMLEELVNMKR
ncbi:MAG: flagellar hook-basal body complex protein [Oscillospiraceae bacterium]|nr:flagellar hook-basal body complex protein [Oscillospiraceae bacterium]